MKKYTTMRFPGFKYKALTLSYDDDVIFDKKSSWRFLISTG